MDNFDLDAAAKAGLISEEQALKLRNFHAAARGETLADQERFGAIDGLSDVMTALGLFLAIGAMLAIAATNFSLITALPVALVCWWLAEMFTVRRKLTMTSFVLYIWYTIATTVFGFAMVMFFTGRALLQGPGGLLFTTDTPLTPETSILTGLFATAAGVLYWRRFQVPVAYASTLFAALHVLTQVTRLMLPDAAGWVANLVLLVSGLLFFAVAMAWDISDIRRETRRADVAFWLHAFAGFMIARAMFKMIYELGSTTGWDRLLRDAYVPPDSLAAVAVICLVLLFAFVALAIDRRSLLVSSLGYVLPATAMLAGSSGVMAPVAAALVVGLALVVTSLFWRSMRKPIVEALPVALQAQLPRTDLVFETARPVK